MTTMPHFQLWTVLVVLSCPSSLAAHVEVPGSHHVCYERPGHLQLGILTPIHHPGDSSSFCSEQFYAPVVMEILEAYVYAINQVNTNLSLLPNTTLGFVVLDDCFWDMAALSKAVYFLPVADKANSSSNLYSAAIDPPTSSSQSAVECQEGTRQFDIVGVTGVSSSRKAVMVSTLMGVFHLPVVGTLATSDELSDKSRYEYFLRVVPPDNFQARAMLNFINELGWTYISLIYSEGSYGERGARLLERHASSHGICIAYENMIDSDAKKPAIEGVVRGLIQNPRARVVVLIIAHPKAKMLYEIVEERDLIGRFVWVAGDAVGVRLSAMSDGAVGTFALQPVFGESSGFSDYFRALTPQNNHDNPWMQEYWADLYDCSWEESPGTNTSSCWDVEDHPYVNLSVNPAITKSIDSIYTYALGLHDLISERCPTAFGDQAALKECITGQELLWSLKNTSFIGASGHISFNEQGDMLGRYEIVHRSWQAVHTVGVWDSHGGEAMGLQLRWDDIDWEVYRQTGRQGHLSENNTDVTIPTSDCSDTCGPRQYYISKEVPCCWECYDCRDNEILVDNHTGCAPCLDATWPDSENATQCVPIPPTFLAWDTSLAAVMASVALLGDVLWVISAVLYVRHWHTRLIKASSRQLCVIMLFGIFVAYNAMFAFIGMPRNEMCAVQRYSFNVSVTLIYAPLLMKTSRVYRIFAAGKKGKGTPPLTSNLAQTLLTVLLVSLQVALSVTTAIFDPADAKLRMRVSTEPEVELFCNWPLNAFIGPLALNLLLIVATAGCGFMVRKLPQNFNESWYIFVSVSTTSFLWLVFLPTYFTTFYAHHQSVLLASCLVINATVTLLCLYLPKYYALYFVEEEKMQFGTMTSSSVNPTSHPT